MATLGDLVVNLRANTNPFAKGMGEGSRRLVSFRKAAVASFAAVSASLLAVVAVFKGKVLPQFAKLDEAAKLSQATGFDTRDVLAYGFAAEQTGTAATSLTNGMQRLQRMVGQARDGSSAAVSAFASLGISLSDLQNNTADENLMAIADAFKGMKNEADQAAAANAIFGKSGGDMINFLKQGSEGLKAFKSEAAGLGILFSSAELAKIEAANDAMNRLGRTVEGMWQKIAVQTAPAVESLSNELAELANDEETVRGLAISLGELAETVVTVTKALGSAWTTGRKWADGLTYSVTELGEAFGALPEGTAEEFAKMQRESRNTQPSKAFTPPEQVVNNAGGGGGLVAQISHFNGLMNQGAKMYAQAWGKFMTAQQKARQDAEQKHLSMTERAAQIIAQNLTPDETFMKAMDELGDLVLGGFLSEAQGDREAARLKAAFEGATSNQEDQGTPGGAVASAQAGSAEAFSAIAAAMREASGRSGKSDEVKATEKNTEAVKDVGETIKVNTFTFATVQEF